MLRRRPKSASRREDENTSKTSAALHCPCVMGRIEATTVNAQLSDRVGSFWTGHMCVFNKFDPVSGEWSPACVAIPGGDIGVCG